MLSKPFTVASATVNGALVLTDIGTPPLNRKIVYVTIALLAILLAIGYRAGVRKRFAGPPISKVSKEHERELSGMDG